MLRITFVAADGLEITRELSGVVTDNDLRRLRDEIEVELGEPLPLSHKTGFPIFTITDVATGKEIGGG